MTADKHTEDELDRALEDPALAELFSALRAQASRPAPPVSPQLGLLLSTGAAPSPRRRRVRGATVGLVVVGVVAGGVGAAAAAGHLPQPLRSVSDVGERQAPRPVTGDEPTSPIDIPPPSTTNDAPGPAPTSRGSAEDEDTAAASDPDGEGSPSGRDAPPASQGSTDTSDGGERDESDDAEPGSHDDDADTDDAGSTQTDDDGDDATSEDSDSDSGSPEGGGSDPDEDDPDDGGDSSSGDGTDVDD